jgi:hypothetical protein
MASHALAIFRDVSVVVRHRRAVQVPAGTGKETTSSLSVSQIGFYTVAATVLPVLMLAFAFQFELAKMVGSTVHSEQPFYVYPFGMLGREGRVLVVRLYAAFVAVFLFVCEIVSLIALADNRPGNPKLVLFGVLVGLFLVLVAMVIRIGEEVPLKKDASRSGPGRAPEDGTADTTTSGTDSMD